MTCATSSSRAERRSIRSATSPRQRRRCAAGDYVRFHSRTAKAHPAVTLAVAKRKGTNAITVAHQVEAKLDTLRGYPARRPEGHRHAQLRRDGAGEVERAALAHVPRRPLGLGAHRARARLREAAVVLIAIPVTLALTLFVFYLYGYTLNRITLFALIFSIGILVDDAIVVVENIVRHARHADDGAAAARAIASSAVDEVGNPTILATLTVVAAILPMAFVGGLMGPYMRPIPVGASAAMLFSLVVAFIVTPWAPRACSARARSRQHTTAEDRLTRLYRRVMAA